MKFMNRFTLPRISQQISEFLMKRRHSNEYSHDGNHNHASLKFRYTAKNPAAVKHPYLTQRARGRFYSRKNENEAHRFLAAPNPPGKTTASN